MKRALALLICGLVSAAVIGCEANAKIGDTDDSTSHKTEYKKTTYSDDGDRTVKTETRTERSY
jgi:hypothetical protein